MIVSLRHGNDKKNEVIKRKENRVYIPLEQYIPTKRELDNYSIGDKNRLLPHEKRFNQNSRPY